MKHFFTLIAAACLILACSKNVETAEEPKATEFTNAAAAAKTGVAAQELTFNVANLFPEGVVYDKFNRRFYVSSTSQGTIGIVTTDGVYSPFITDPALIGTNGLEIDEARKLLYVTNAAAGSVAVYDISTGQRVRLIDLKALLPGAPVFINDIALDPQGNAYATNSRTPVIYRITPDGTASVFYQDPAFATTGFGFNGIEYANQGFLLVAYSAGQQVIRFPISNPAAYNVVSLNAPLSGPDGLLLSKNGKELVVVNNAGGGNGYVSLFRSDDQWKTGTLASKFETGSVFPTTATTDGKSVFVLYAYLNRRAQGQSAFTIKQVPGIVKF
jgi:sugar lactone lactonase YvrE